MSGAVRDSSGAGIEGATVVLKNAAGSVLANMRTGAAGRFQWAAAAGSFYHLRVSAPAFESRELTVSIPRGESADIEVVLEPAAVPTRVTVSATRGAVDDLVSSPYVAIVEELDGAAARPLSTIGNVLEHEPDVVVQQSTYGQVSPILRGLTGYHVLNLIDGIRFNNSTFRSGPNQYLGLVEPSQAQRVEALLGPAGAQYGSDSLGGTINVVTLEPRFAAGADAEVHGDFQVAGATADLSGLAAARLTLGTERVSWLIGASGRRLNDVRAGGGVDSRNVFRRLFNLEPDQIQALTGSRQQDTGFRQYGLHTKFAARIRPDQHLSLWYQRGVQDGVRGYKDLLGGLGRLESAFDPQVLNFFYARYEKLGAGALDSVSGTFSVNSQTDGSARRNLRWTDPLTTDFSRVNSFGYSGQATTHRGNRVFAAFGGDIYDERIESSRRIDDPVRATSETVRPLYPDASTYATIGLFGQGSLEVVPDRLRAGFGGRLTGIRFRTVQDARFGVPAASQWFRDFTWNSSLSWQVSGAFGLQALVSRGFRAPNLNDLGAIGLNDLGYEVPAADAIPAGALLSTDAGEGAVSKGMQLSPLQPESLLNYEFGVRFTARRLYARIQGFDAELDDPIVRRTLLFNASAPPAQLAGLPVTVLPQTAAQRNQGVVGISTAFDPRAVKAFVNDGRSRYYGLEALTEFALSSRWSVEANYTYMNGRELDPNRPARRLPPQHGSVAVRYVPSGRRVWFEALLAAAGKQDRLSGGDLDDERIGASRRRRDIADFFQGARVQPLLDPSGRIFTPTGETLRQIQDRVLPLGAVVNGVRVIDDNTRVPLYLSTAGWITANLRAGVPVGERWQLLLALENVLDSTYRVHGSGIDAPGITGFAGLRFRF